MIDYGVKIIAVSILLAFGGAISKANAQNESLQLNNIDSALNGLFTPNAAERFFQEGREDFEEEIEIVNNSEIHFNDNLLQIDQELIEQIRENQKNNNTEEVIF